MNIQGQGESILDGDVVAGDENAMPTAVNARTLAMQAIEQDNLRRLESETGMKLIADPEPAPTPVDDQLTKQLTDPTPAPTPTTYKVKVEGQELEVSADDLVRTYQKNAAADARLRRATEMLQEAEQLREQMLATPAPTETPEPTTTLSKDAVRSQVETAVSKLFEGEQDAAVEALATLIASQPAPTPAAVQAPIDVDAVARQIQERMATQASFAKIKSDYPDLVSDQNLEMLAALQIDQRVATGIPRSVAMLEVADSLYSSLGKTPMGRPEPIREPAPATPNIRLENKQKLDTVPSASRAAALPTEPEDGNPSDVIAEMAARRLGQSLPRRTG